MTVTHVVATEQAEGVIAGTRRQRDPGEPDSRCWPRDSQPLPGSVSRPRSGSESYGAGCGLGFLAFAGTARKTGVLCPGGGCLASRVASCSCELLTEGRWAQSWLEQWRAGLEGPRGLSRVARQTCMFPTCRFSAVDLPWPPETTAAVVTAPHSRAREAVGESLVHVPLGPSWIPWSPQATRQQQHRCSGALPLPAPFPGPPPSPRASTGPSQALPEPPKL